MVRQHELPWNARAVIYVDTRNAAHRGSGPRGTFERSVSVAASVLLHLRDQNYDLELVTCDENEHDGSGGIEGALVRLAEVTPVIVQASVTAMARLGRAGNGLLIAIVRPPADAVELSEHPEVRALLRAGRGYRACVALVLQRHDDERCTILARLLQVAGWRAAVVTPDEPLVDAWQRAMVGVAVPALSGAADD
jgi:uncharacterized protein (DUF58 family)